MSKAEQSLWTLESCWNDTLAIKKKPQERRDHIWAGEIGMPFYDRYLKMSGIQPTEPLEDRVLRKMSAGIWFEKQIEYILQTIGILKEAQTRVEIPATDKTLKVTGKIDQLAGGITDWNEARNRVKTYKFPEFIEAICMKLIEGFEKKYPKGLEEVLYEIKSVNSQVFWAKKDYLEEAYPHHRFQLYTYLKATKKEKGRILYISKDDLTIKEFLVMNPHPKLEEEWQKDVEQMTYYWKNQIEPPKPEFVVFDKRKKLRFQHNKEKCIIQGCWTENWMVKWSQYFSMVTGCETEEEWMEKIKPDIRDRNIILKDAYKVKLEGKK